MIHTPLRPLICLLALSALGEPARAEAPPGTIYRYRTREGIPAYTDDLSRIPTHARKRAAPVDLSHISLNRELGHDLRQAVQEAYDSLMASDLCVRARDSSVVGRLKTLWREQGHLVALAGAALLLLGISPWIVRWIPPSRWVRVLGWTLPLLFAIGVISHMAHRTAQTFRVLRAAEPLCRSDTERANLNAREKLGIVNRLKETLHHRSHAIDRTLERQK